MQSETGILQSLRTRRRIIIEVILIAFILGFVINLFSSAVDEYVKKIPGWPYVSFILLSVVIVEICLYYLGKVHTESRMFRVFFPIVLDQNGNPRIETIPGYTPSYNQFGNSVFHSWQKNNKTDNEFERMKKQLGLVNGKPEKTEGGFFFNSLNKVVVVQLLRVIQEHSKHTQSSLGYYHPKYEEILQKIATSEVILDPEKILGHPLYGFPKKLLLPKSCNEPVVDEYISAGIDIKSTRITLRSCYSSLHVDIQKRWTIITKANSPKIFSIATRTIQKATLGNSLSLLSVPVKVDFTIHRKSVWSGQSAEMICSWFNLLYEEVYKWMAIEHYMENDLERLLVELYQKSHESHKG